MKAVESWACTGCGLLWPTSEPCVGESLVCSSCAVRPLPTLKKAIFWKQPPVPESVADAVEPKQEAAPTFCYWCRSPSAKVAWGLCEPCADGSRNLWEGKDARIRELEAEVAKITAERDEKAMLLKGARLEWKACQAAMLAAEHARDVFKKEADEHYMTLKRLGGIEP